MSTFQFPKVHFAVSSISFVCYKYLQILYVILQDGLSVRLCTLYNSTQFLTEHGLCILYECGCHIEIILDYTQSIIQSIPV